MGSILKTVLDLILSSIHTNKPFTIYSSLLFTSCFRSASKNLPLRGFSERSVIIGKPIGSTAKEFGMEIVSGGGITGTDIIAIATAIATGQGTTMMTIGAIIIIIMVGDGITMDIKLTRCGERLEAFVSYKPKQQNQKKDKLSS